jgi:hypothetical protein
VEATSSARRPLPITADPMTVSVMTTRCGACSLSFSRNTVSGLKIRSQRPEELSHGRGQGLWLLHGSEMAALRHDDPLSNIRVGLLGYMASNPILLMKARTSSLPPRWQPAVTVFASGRNH